MRFGGVLLGTAVCAFVLGLAVNYVTKRQTADFHPIETENQAVLTDGTEMEYESTKIGFSSLHDLSNPTRFSNHFARTKALLDLLADADQITLQKYLVQSDELTAHHFRKEVQTEIIQRWSVVDPKSAFAVISEELPYEKRQHFLDVLFREWSVSNLQEAITYAAKLDVNSKELVVISMVRSRADLTVAERRDIAHQLECEWIAINILCNLFDDSIFLDPEQEWYAFVDGNPDQLSNLSEQQIKALGHLFVAWIERDGLEVLDIVRNTLPSGFSMLKTMEFVAFELVDNTPQLALHLALEMAQIEQNYRYRYLVKDLVGRWAESDPRNALNATFDIEGRSLQHTLQQRVLYHWAEQDPQALLEVIESLPTNLQIQTRQFALVAIAATTPEIAVDMLSDFSVQKNRDIVAFAIARSWVKTDVSQVFEWVESDRNVEHIKFDLIGVVFQELAELDPVLAVEEAVRRPVDDRGDGWEASVISWLVKSDDVDSAVQLLPLVRAGATRVRAYREVIEHLIEEQYYTELAVNLFHQLSENEVKRVSYLVPDLTRVAPRQLYKDLYEIQSERVRRYTASLLYSNNRNNSIFTAEELKSLQEEARDHDEVHVKR